MNDNPHSSLTRVEDLAEHIRLLASVEATDAPFLSAFLDLRNGVPACSRFVRERAEALQGHLTTTERSDLKQALEMVEERLAQGFGAGTEGVALFARARAGGGFFSCLELGVALENGVTVCARGSVQAIDLRSELARAAAQQGASVGVIHSEDLDRLGGVVSLPTDGVVSDATRAVAVRPELELVA